jgi:hypothetical protein
MGVHLKLQCREGAVQFLCLILQLLPWRVCSAWPSQFGTARALRGCRCCRFLRSNAASNIVWGIVAKKNDLGIDCAHKFELAENAQLLLTRLNDLIGQATLPMTDGVKHRSVVFDGLRRCVITLVPEALQVHTWPS